MKKVFNHNTHLGVNVKTVLNSDRIMRVGKDYQGVLKRDVEIDEFRYDEHFTFVETLPWSMKRNPRVYNGRYISVTRQKSESMTESITITVITIKKKAVTLGLIYNITN